MTPREAEFDPGSPASRTRRVHRWGPTALVIGFLWLLALPQLDRYSVTWDEALGDLFFGERYLSWFTSFDERYLDFRSEPYAAEHTPDLASSPFRNRPWEYYPLVNVLGSICTAVLHRGLGWMDPFDAFHLINLLFASLLIALGCRFLAVRIGQMQAVLSLGAVLTLPRVTVHMLANTKDFPLMVLYTVALFVFVSALERGSAGRLVLAGALTGVALACKANALFLAPTYLLVVLATAAWQRFGSPVRLLAASALAAVSALLIVFGSWPYLWPDPIGRIGLHLQYIAGQVDQVRGESLLSPHLAVLLTTPIPFLLAVALGLVPTLRGVARRNVLDVTLCAWIAVTTGRLFLPGAVNFDGVRHFLELFPALAIIAVRGIALAAEWLAPRLRTFGPRRAQATAALAVAALVLLGNAAPTLRYHPHQIAYWNGLVGGPAGAFRSGLAQAGDYWGLSYRQGQRWLNDNAPPNSRLAVPVVEHAVRLTAPHRLRADVELLRVSVPNTPRMPPEFMDRLLEVSAHEPDRPVFVMFVRLDDWRNAISDWCQQNLEPVWQLDVAGATLLEIYRLPS